MNWSGNIRELKNIMERLIILSDEIIDVNEKKLCNYSSLKNSLAFLTTFFNPLISEPPAVAKNDLTTLLL